MWEPLLQIGTKVSNISFDKQAPNTERLSPTTIWMNQSLLLMQSTIKMSRKKLRNVMNVCEW